MILRFRCSRWTDLSVHDGPKRAGDIERALEKTQDSIKQAPAGNVADIGKARKRRR
jgi:hypothetical protein